MTELTPDDLHHVVSRTPKDVLSLMKARNLGRSQGWRLTPSEVAQALRSAAASGSYIAEPILRPAN